MEKEQIRETNKLFYQVTENLDLEEIEYLVEKLNTYLHIQKITSMKYDVDYIKSIYVLYEETDPEDEESFYTVDYTIGEHFDDETINSLCNSECLTDDISNLVTNEIIGELKSLFIRDNTNTVLLDSEDD